MSDIREELVSAVKFALGHHMPKVGVRIKEETLRDAAAEKIVEHIYRANFKVTKGRPAAPSGYVIPTLDPEQERARIFELIQQIQDDHNLRESLAWAELVMRIRQRLEPRANGEP